MNGKQAKRLRKYARIKGYREEGMKELWQMFNKDQKGKASAFMKHVIRASEGESDAAPEA